MGAPRSHRQSCTTHGRPRGPGCARRAVGLEYSCAQIQGCWGPPHPAQPWGDGWTDAGQTGRWDSGEGRNPSTRLVTDWSHSQACGDSMPGGENGDHKGPVSGAWAAVGSQGWLWQARAGATWEELRCGPRNGRVTQHWNSPSGAKLCTVQGALGLASPAASRD